jgi:hypothetical protein
MDHFFGPPTITLSSGLPPSICDCYQQLPFLSAERFVSYEAASKLAGIFATLELLDRRGQMLRSDLTATDATRDLVDHGIAKTMLAASIALPVVPRFVRSCV